nr:polysaccharide deacetylase family protein [Bacteroidota bacterium]
MQLITTSKKILKPFYLRLQKQMDVLLNGSCAVLLYHRVNNLKTDPQLLNVTPQHFDEQLSYLKKNHFVIQIDELLHNLEHKKRFPKKCVALTFDDGYADNYLEALPILESHNMQALFYIATGTLNTDNEFWWDAVERIILLNENIPLQDQFSLDEKVFDLKNLDTQKRFQIYTQLLPLFRKMVAKQREEKIAELAAMFNSLSPRASHRPMTFDELKKLSASKSAVIGAHTHMHPSLGALDYNQQLEEIKTSKDILENILSNNLIHFSFPFGTIADYDADTIVICKNLDFKMVAANFPYIVNRNSNIFHFPRFLVRDWNQQQFSASLNFFIN